MSVGSEAELPWGRPFPANKSARAERWLLFRTSLRFPSLGNRLLPFRSTCRSLAINLVLMGGTFSDLMAQFDPVNRKRKGDQFELVCKWFLENDPTYQSLLRRVWMWDDWPGRQGIDAGIDLVAEEAVNPTLRACRSEKRGPQILRVLQNQLSFLHDDHGYGVELPCELIFERSEFVRDFANPRVNLSPDI